MRRPLSLVVFGLAAGVAATPGPGPFRAATPAIPASELAARRDEIARQVGPEGMLVLAPSWPARRTGDVFHEFRQNSNLYYLTGIAQEGTALILMPGNRSAKEILFMLPRDSSREVWEGSRLSGKEARKRSGIATVHETGELPAMVAALAGGRAHGADDGEFEVFLQAVAAGRARVWLDGTSPGLQAQEGEDGRDRDTGLPGQEWLPVAGGPEVKDISPRLASMRLVKSPLELEMLERSVAITMEAHREAMRTVRPGMQEYEIEAVVEYVFRRSGAREAFPSIVASGANGTILHYQSNGARIEEDALVLLDIGAEVGLYAADLTRTFPAGGRFSEAQATLYGIVLAAQKAALEEVRPGISLATVQARGEKVLRDGLRRLGLMETVEGVGYWQFALHGISHWLGLDVHDVGRMDPVLRPGMVFTVEPGLYIREDLLARELEQEQDAARRRTLERTQRDYAGLGVRIEDDVLVTENGFRLLSAGLPRELREVEAMLRRDPAWTRQRPVPRRSRRP